MALAQGPGNRITSGGLSIVAPYSRVYCQVQPLQAGTPGVVTPGTVDSTGNYLHFRYWGNIDLGGRSGGNQTRVQNSYINAMPGTADPQQTQLPDFIPNRIVVEFDAINEFTLPFCGFLELIGGAGEYKFGMEVYDVVDARFYDPDIRYLRNVNNTDSPKIIQVPDFHTFLMGSNSTSTFTVDGAIPLQAGIILPGAPIVAGTALTIPAHTTALTGVKL